MAGTLYISGLTSNIDWDNIVTQLITADHKPVDLVTSKKPPMRTSLAPGNHSVLN